MHWPNIFIVKRCHGPIFSSFQPLSLCACLLFCLFARNQMHRNWSFYVNKINVFMDLTVNCIFILLVLLACELLICHYAYCSCQTGSRGWWLDGTAQCNRQPIGQNGGEAPCTSTVPRSNRETDPKLSTCRIQRPRCKLDSPALLSVALYCKSCFDRVWTQAHMYEHYKLMHSHASTCNFREENRFRPCLSHNRMNRLRLPFVPSSYRWLRTMAWIE